MPLIAYITSAQLQSRLSSTGVTLRFDDDTSPPNEINQVIADASVEADGYALLYYPQNGLSQSNWYQMRVTDIAAMFACSRRANPIPQSVQIRYEKAIKDLEGVRGGSITIPDCPASRNACPTVSQPRVSLQPFPHTLIERGRSTGVPTEGYVPNDDARDWFDYGSGI